LPVARCPLQCSLMLRAIIFDMDGVICDSEPLHKKAFQRVLEEEGIILTDNEYYDEYLAFDDRGCFTKIFEVKQKSLDTDKLKKLLARKARYFDELMTDGLVIYPGAEAFVRKAAAKVPIALASGARRLEVEYVLKKAKVRGLFTAVVSADDVAKGKPDPESFLAALKTINERRLHETDAISPGDCLVIEDSRHGIAAARSAGMKCAAVTTSYKAEQLGEANLILDSLMGLELEPLEKLFV
jgi:beta-phosphoglucomutase